MKQHNDAATNSEAGRNTEAAREGGAAHGADASQYAPPHSPTSSKTLDDENDMLGKGLEALADYLAVGELMVGWSKNIGQIASMELERSAIAFKNILEFKLCLLPMLLLLYVSLCGSAAYIAYAELQSVYAGLAAFLLAQLASVFCIRRMISYNRSLIGFEHTKKHTVKAKNDIVNALK